MEGTVHPSLNRMARCVCGRREPSANWQSLAFFEARGEGSECAMKHCKCGYYECAHDAEQLKALNIHNTTVIERGICSGFTPHGAYEHDSYYCGCRGWD